MNLPEIVPYDEQAIDTVVTVINRAKSQLGIRQNLAELAKSRKEFLSRAKVSLNALRSPLAYTAEKFIYETIEKKWNLTPTVMFILRYSGSSQDECAHCFYFEAVFSQVSIEYPVPQATVSVFFRVEEKHLEPPEVKGAPSVTFRIEGEHTNHDIRFVVLTVDWLLAVLKMKIKLFERIEALRLF